MGSLTGTPSICSITPARSITSTGNQLAKLNSVIQDPAGQLINTAGWRQFSCPYTGCYLVVVQICISTSATSGTMAAEIYQNGSRIYTGSPFVLSSATSFPISTAIATVYPCNAGDTLEAGFTISTTTGSPELWNDSTLTYASFIQIS